MRTRSSSYPRRSRMSIKRSRRAQTSLQWADVLLGDRVAGAFKIRWPQVVTWTVDGAANLGTTGVRARSPWVVPDHCVTFQVWKWRILSFSRARGKIFILIPITVAGVPLLDWSYISKDDICFVYFIKFPFILFTFSQKNKYFKYDSSK